MNFGDEAPFLVHEGDYKQQQVCVFNTLNRAECSSHRHRWRRKGKVQ